MALVNLVPLRNIGRDVLFALDKNGADIEADGLGPIRDLSGATLIHTLTNPPKRPPEKGFRLVLPAAGFETTLRAQLESKVLQLAGDEYDSCLWAASGSDAVELSLWSYAEYHGIDVTDLTFLVREGSYHGATALTSALTTRSRLPQRGKSPFVVHVIPETPDANRWSDDVINALKRHPGDRKVFIFEPVSTTGPCFWPGFAALSAVSEWCNENGVGIICDEVASGAFRNGWFTAASNENAIRPHAITLAKSLTTGIVPLSLCLLRHDVGARLRAAGRRVPGFTISLNDISAGIASDRLDRFEALLADDTFEKRARDIQEIASILRENLMDEIRVEYSPTTLRLTTTDSSVAVSLTTLLRSRNLYAYKGETLTTTGAVRHVFLFSPPLDLDETGLSLSWGAITDLFPKP